MQAYHPTHEMKAWMAKAYAHCHEEALSDLVWLDKIKHWYALRKMVKNTRQMRDMYQLAFEIVEYFTERDKWNDNKPFCNAIRYNRFTVPPIATTINGEIEMHDGLSISINAVLRNCKQDCSDHINTH